MLHELLKAYGKEETLKRGEYLCMAGELNQNLYYVESGSLMAFIIDGEEEQIIRLAYPGSFIVALDAYFGNAPTQIYMRAIKRCRLKVISKAAIEEHRKESSNEFWEGILNDLVLQQFERELDLLTSSPAERYLRVLSRSPHLFQQIPHRHIAHYLRMSPETLSRLKKLDLNQG